jgi:hypothetical protein
VRAVIASLRIARSRRARQLNGWHRIAAVITANVGSDSRGEAAWRQVVGSR